MFEVARIKLTVWYVGIIMLISLCFSFIIFYLLTNEFISYEKLYWLRRQDQIRQRLNTLPECPEVILAPDIALQRELTDRLKFALLLINVGILGLSSAGSYLLAGKTLKPIQNMIRQQNRFITDASHELRTPIAAMMSEIEVNLRDKNLGLSEAKKLLQSNLEEVHRLHLLTEGLLKLNSYRVDRRPFSFGPVQISNILDEALKKIHHLADKKKIVIQKELKDLTVKGDFNTLSELLVILLDNAIKYSPENSTILISSRKKRGMATIDIKDTGLGIAKEDLPLIFDRFYRADKSRGHTHGYGLGLSIAHTIAKAHGGDITVKSIVGKGSTFTVHIPMNKKYNI